MKEKKKAIEIKTKRVRQTEEARYIYIKAENEPLFTVKKINNALN